MVWKIFIFSFVLASVFQGLRWFTFGALDNSLWAQQSMYVDTKNQLQYDPKLAYAYPGSTISHGSLIFHHVFHLSYTQSLYYFLTISNSLVIASISAFCFLLLPSSSWWLAALLILGPNNLFEYTTPPSALSATLFILTSVITLKIFTNPLHHPFFSLSLWATIAGLFLSTRLDTAIFSLFFLFIILLGKIGLPKSFFLLSTTCLVFSLSNPFLWPTPLSHLSSILEKGLYHYSNYPPEPSIWSGVISLSAIAIVSFIYGLFFLIIPKRELSTIFPKPFLLSLIIVSIVLYSVFLSARIQALRYFVPVALLWQVLLPAFTFSLISLSKKFSIKRKSQLQILILAIMTFFSLNQLIRDLYHFHTLPQEFRFAHPQL